MDVKYCVSCKKECGSHSCKKCGYPCHAIEPCCKIGEDENEEEESYGASVICKTCSTKVSPEGPLPPSEVKATKVWNWKERVTATPPTVSLKSAKRKPVKRKWVENSSESEGKKFACIECLSLVVKGEREERTAYLCRSDVSSINRHKRNWHTVDGKKKAKTCTIVPSDTKTVKDLKQRIPQAKPLISTTPGTIEKSVVESSSQSLECIAADNSIVSSDNSSVTCSHDDYRSLSAIQDDLFDEKITAEVEPLGDTANLVMDTLLELDDESCTILSQEGSSTHNKSSSTLLDYVMPVVKSPKKESTLTDVMNAIEKLDIKVSNVGKSYTAMSKLAFEDEDKDLQKDICAMRKADNINQLVDATDLIEMFYDEFSETAVLRCAPCFKYHCELNGHYKDLTPLKAQQNINSNSSSGSLGTGLFLKQGATRLLLQGHNQIWYRQKNRCIDHLTLIGTGSSTHKKAMDLNRKNQRIQSRTVTAATNIFRAAIVDVKQGAAGKHLETLLSLLSLCGVDIGNIGHSRNHFNSILYCLEKSVDGKTLTWLESPLPSTLLPPHFWVTVDKATPSRTTNQAILIVARNEEGLPCPIPVDAPKVYSEFDSASYDYLADMIVDTISKKFSRNVLTRVCGVAADGPYQATGFRKKLLELLSVTDAKNSSLALPVTWDPAHLINLGGTDIKDSTSESGKHFQQFIKRCNVFNSVLANGKGFAFLEMIDSSARRPVTFAAQRFASSSYEQWVKIESSYDAYWKAFEHLYPNRIEEEEYQYMIAGFDFVTDLLAFLDTLKPIVDLMLHVQSLDTPIWKLKCWWPRVKRKLQHMIDTDDFPRLKKCGILKPGDQYKGVALLEGWMFTEVEGEGKNKIYTWTTRDEEDIRQDRIRFAKDLLDSINKRVEGATSQAHLSTLAVFDALTLVELHCGDRVDNNVTKNVEYGYYDEFGVAECGNLMEAVSKMKHVIDTDLDFDRRLAHRYMMSIKEAIGAGIWDGHCSHWFIEESTNLPLTLKESTVVELSMIDSNEFFSPKFLIRLNNGKIMRCRLHEQNVYASFYSNEVIYSIAKPPSCILIDVALAKGGPEAITESFYATMRAQQQSGGQHNETLVKRTKLSWCLPSLNNCEGIINDSITTYLKGDDNIRPHRSNIFFSSRAKEYNVSKVIDRVDSEGGRCPFLI